MDVVPPSSGNSQSNSLPQHYYAGDKYFSRSHSPSSSDKYLYQFEATKYGVGAANNRKHYRQKLATKSTTSHPLDDGGYADSNALLTPSSFLQNSINLVSESLHSLRTINVDPKSYYLTHDDLSSANSDIDVIDDGETDEDCDGALEVASSSCCSMGSTVSVGGPPGVLTSGSIAAQNDDSKHHPLMGMILVTLSAVMYAGLNLSVKVLMAETPWQELMFIRMGITWIATCIWIFVQFRGKMTLFGPKSHRALLLIRAFFLWGAMFSCWWSFEYLPVGDGTTLAMSFPVWVSVFAHFVWRNEGRDGVNSSSQRLDLFGWICVIGGLAGIAFVAQPSFIFGASADEDTSNRDIGIVIGVGSAICAGAQYVIVNYTKKHCHWLQVEQVTAALSTFVLCPLGFLCFAAAEWHSNGDRFVIAWASLDAVRWIEEIALGLLGFFALALLTRGSQLDAPARTAICLYLEIPFVYIGQCVLTRSLPNVYVFVGIFLVLSSVIIPAIRKMRRANAERKVRDKLAERLRAQSDDETMPLIEDAAAHQRRAPSVGTGVTVDWSTDEDSAAGDIDSDGIDVDGIYGAGTVTAH